jgi:hypothetical protein
MCCQVLWGEVKSSQVKFWPFGVGLTVYFMKQFEVTIKSVTPYMQDRMDDQKLEQWEKNRGHIHEHPDASKQDALRAEFACYRNDNGLCFIPADHFRGSFINAGSYVKAKVGGRSKSMKVIVAAMFTVLPEQIILPDYDAIDKRSAVNKHVKARIIRIRPKWNDWQVTFTLQVGERSITVETIKTIIEYAGNYVGIGSFRPTANGMFGRFELVDIKEVQL